MRKEVVMKKSAIVISLFIGASDTMAVTPEQILADGKDTFAKKGVTIRKGSVAALIMNVQLLNAKLKSKETGEHVERIIKDLRAAMPALEAIDVMSVFQASDWFESEARPGNVMVGVLFLQQFPQYLTQPIKEKLRHISIRAHSRVKAEIATLF